MDAADLEEALEWARALFGHLTGGWEIPEAAVRPYFSGKKGFHLTVDTRVFMAPAPSLVAPEVLHRLTVSLAQELGVGRPGPIDIALRDRVRLLRLPNTRHEASGLFKVPLRADELAGLSIAEIVGLAREPRPLAGVDPTGLLAEGDLPVSPRARERFDEAAERSDVAARRRRRPDPEESAQPGVLACPARRTLLARAAPAGRRNSTAIRLASWLREGGLGPDAVEAALLGWNARNAEPLDQEEMGHVLLSAFASPTAYRYGCRDPLIEPFCPPDPEAREGCPYHRSRYVSPRHQ